MYLGNMENVFEECDSCSVIAELKEGVINEGERIPVNYLAVICT